MHHHKHAEDDAGVDEDGGGLKEGIECGCERAAELRPRIAHLLMPGKVRKPPKDAAPQGIAEVGVEHPAKETGGVLGIDVEAADQHQYAADTNDSHKAEGQIHGFHQRCILHRNCWTPQRRGAIQDQEQIVMNSPPRDCAVKCRCWG